MKKIKIVSIRFLPIVFLLLCSGLYGQIPIRAGVAKVNITPPYGTIGTLPGEFFSETGLKLKKEAPCKYYFTISLANAMIGYVPPASQFLLGGYETWLCSGSLVEVNAEEKISNTLAGLIKSVQ